MKNSYMKPTSTAIQFVFEGMIAESITVNNKSEGGDYQGTRRRAWDSNNWAGGVSETEDAQ